MHTVDMIRPGVNPARLDAELRARLDKAYHGLSVQGSRVRVYLAGEVPAHQVAEARILVQAHDPGLLTPAQEQAAARRTQPFFMLEPEALARLAEGMDSATFRQEMARAFAQLRDLVQT